MVEFTDRKERIDIGVVHGFLTESYWATGIDRETVERSMEGSLCFALIKEGSTIAFARVVTDQATFAYLADVFVLPGHRGLGLGRRLVEGVLSDARLGRLRRWALRTEDAHGLYRRYGFEVADTPGMWMDRVEGDVGRGPPRASATTGGPA